jgi:hypothetical protein
LPRLGRHRPPRAGVELELDVVADRELDLLRVVDGRHDHVEQIGRGQHVGLGLAPARGRVHDWLAGLEPDLERPAPHRTFEQIGEGPHPANDIRAVTRCGLPLTRCGHEFGAA